MKLILTGDINLMNVTDAAVPFARVAGELRCADVVFGNLECCLYQPPASAGEENEGFFADPEVGAAALRAAGVHAVGLANNVNYGAEAIGSSIGWLDRGGIAHTGAGADRAAARAPALLERDGLRVGFLQRSSVYWPTNHEAGERSAGIAVIRGHTAYQVPMHRARPDIPPLNRPGIPPNILTWADPAYLKSFCEDIAALRDRAGLVIASCHWGLGIEVLDYMTQIAHAAVDAGADAVLGHGPHHSLAIEVYRGRPVFYGLGSFSFHTGHRNRKHGDWIGMMATLAGDRGGISSAAFRFVRHNERNETVLCRLADEQQELRDLEHRSRGLGTALRARGDSVHIELAP